MYKETHLRSKNTYRLKVKGWKKIFNASSNLKKVERAILLLDKIDFKSNSAVRNKEKHYIIKESFHQEDITITNICTKCHNKLAELKGEIALQ